MNCGTQNFTKIRDNIPVLRYFESKGWRFPFSNWSYRGEREDYEVADEEHMCELCGNTGLRYHFAIDDFEKNKLWVGSACIRRFNVAVYDENNNQFIGEDALKVLEQHILHDQLKKIRDESVECLRNLFRATRGEDRIFVEKIGLYHASCNFQKRFIILSPNKMLKMFNLLNSCSIKYTPSWFKLSCNKKEEQIEFSLLKDEDKKKLRQFMNDRQENFFWGNSAKIFEKTELASFLLNQRKNSILECLENLINSNHSQKNINFVGGIKEKYGRKRKDKDAVVLTPRQMLYMVDLLDKSDIYYENEWFRLRKESYDLKQLEEMSDSQKSRITKFSFNE